MQLSNFLFMLLGTALGAALVTVGSLVSALAARVRGLKVAHNDQFGTATFVGSVPAPRAASSAPRPPRKLTPVPLRTDIGAEVISALVKAGYQKAVVSQAVWACTNAERATLETWTVAALQRCASGARVHS